MSAEIGRPFPDFALPNQDGKTLKLGDFAGKWLVVYVYPKDDTPGCTIQGKSFTATKKQFDDAGIVVLGVSEDGVESHKSFCDKFAFTIDLLADPERQLLSAAGVGQKRLQGHALLGPDHVRDRPRRRAPQGVPQGEAGRARAPPAGGHRGPQGPGLSVLLEHRRCCHHEVTPMWFAHTRTALRVMIKQASSLGARATM